MSSEIPRKGFSLAAAATLVSESKALREAALRHARADDTETLAAAGLALERAAISYTHTLDEETRKAQQIDYLTIVEQAERDQKPSDN